ncbi:MAG: hypothetical protein WD034_02225 [Parvibaculum sp.]|uniref:hypothetical protein n=1 Tax=Parvibaculum sp. TaxID=2024848 RepID=UPI00349FE18F
MKEPPFDRADGAATAGNAARDEKARIDRWTLFRDVAVFQGKLILDNIKDVVLVPISLGAALVSLFNRDGETGRQFYGVLHAARRVEDWLDKYADADRIPTPSYAQKQDGESIDLLVVRIEDLVKRQYERGGVTANAKDAIDRALDTLQEKLARRG